MDEREEEYQYPFEPVLECVDEYKKPYFCLFYAMLDAMDLLEEHKPNDAFYRLERGHREAERILIERAWSRP